MVKLRKSRETGEPDLKSEDERSVVYGQTRNMLQLTNPQNVLGTS